MPFQSESQRRLFHAKEDRGELPKGTAHRWEEHTPKNKKLPYHKKQSSFLERFTEDLMQKTASKRGSGTSMDTFLEDIINGSGAHAVETAGSLRRHSIKEALEMTRQTHPKLIKQAFDSSTPFTPPPPQFDISPEERAKRKSQYAISEKNDPAFIHANKSWKENFQKKSAAYQQGYYDMMAKMGAAPATKEVASKGVEKLKKLLGRHGGQQSKFPGQVSGAGMGGFAPPPKPKGFTIPEKR